MGCSLFVLRLKVINKVFKNSFFKVVEFNHFKAKKYCYCKKHNHQKNKVMLDTETKRRIDTARDILVGKVPDPKSQVEQITIALIYKFMDDMDKEAVDFGGQASFFAGEYDKYAWTKIFDPKIGGHEMLNLYGEAIVKLNLNPNIPQLFRDIFKNAYLPYRDPETLKLFLKTINEFRYDHSEMLGDAFEYLLSVLGSQGDAGQFRTPRHIIDFIVSALEPKKGESLCDPACGTAGFLISSYKHILAANTSPSPHFDKLNGQGEGSGVRLTPDDRKKLMNNFTGYDISPDMVRLSLVNMYLHGFTIPKIYEYDTLTSEDRWNEYFDVILANPPFMSPKGGIKPHKKFSVQANRSEVLFVDYIAEHIHPATGRAGIIVPEGIIFQSAGAYRQLRKMLVVKEFLYAVVSLPAGIFQPYSGVKTSILLLDKTLAKKTNNILFVKIDNDGFDLGAQRRAIDKNDLTGCLPLLQQYKQALQSGKPFLSDNKNVFLVDKETIAAKDDYNLSIDRYRVAENVKQSKFEMVRLGDVCEIQRGGSPRPIEHFITDDNEGINWIKIGDVSENAKYVLNTKEKIIKEGLKKTRMVYENDFILSNSMSFGRPYIVKITGAIHDGWLLLRMKDKDIIDQDYLYEVLRSAAIKEQYERLATGGVVRNLNSNLVSGVEIPLPPLSVQQQIVAKIENYQAIINGAKQVIENYKPQIDINPDWEMVELVEVCEVINGRAYKQEELLESGKYLVLRVGNFFSNRSWYYSDLELPEDKYCDKGDLLYAWSASFGPRIWDGDKVIYHYHIWKMIPDESKIGKIFLSHILEKDTEEIKAEGGRGIAMMHITKEGMQKRKVPIPPLSEQQHIVRRIEDEQVLVNGNKKLVALYEQKIKDEINKLWQKEPVKYEAGEGFSVAAEG
jgi:type I restriction enzyme M protein